MKTIFLRALEAEDKAATLIASIRNPEATLGRQRFEVKMASFGLLPRSPFAYWVSDNLRQLFQRLPPFEAEGRTVRQGLATADDFRFLREWWELKAAVPRLMEERWFPFAKGGASSPFYADLHLVVNWQRGGLEIQNNLNERGGVRSNVWMLRDTAAKFFFRPGLTYPARPHGSGWFSVVPRRCIFSHNGPMVFADGDSLPIWLAVLNARSFHHLVQLMMARGQGGSGQTLTYEVGMIACTPVPRLQKEDEIELRDLAQRAWSIKRSLDSCMETSHAFALPAVLQVAGDTLPARAITWSKLVSARDAEFSAIQSEIDERCFELYGIDLPDRRAIIEGFGADAEFPNAAVDGDPDCDSEVDEQENPEGSSDLPNLGGQLVSWVAGVAFGRYDVRLATATRSLPAEPEPFDPLPVCSPAMLTGDDGLPLMRSPAGYPVAFPDNGILVDDRGHALDLATAARLVFDEVFKPNGEVWWNQVGTLLDPRDHDLRTWLASSFFEYHLKRHSKSRRKAPILWQLSLPSGHYSIWLYAHRLTRDSFFQIQNDVVVPKLAHEERKLTSFIQSAGSIPSATERKEIAEQEAFVDELRSFLDEIKRVAPLWNPLLDDGVSLTMAPLWRLVQHKPWQKELKNKWSELAAGKYDWAHVAMHLWPERIVPKCATDRSLAIAHGLEDVFWGEGGDGIWSPRHTPTRPVDELVRERTSIAVKAALQGLTEASASNGSTAGTRRSSG
ncbi:hypothetical protein [Mesorhizobium sp. M0816]|uniref:hypothetical protein n=1 Tax=Mesorhizobium sp. M0816 TaxID=2957006 RepID=UPI0033353211